MNVCGEMNELTCCQLGKTKKGTDRKVEFLFFLFMPIRS